MEDSLMEQIVNISKVGYLLASNILEKGIDGSSDSPLSLDDFIVPYLSDKPGRDLFFGTIEDKGGAPQTPDTIEKLEKLFGKLQNGKEILIRDENGNLKIGYAKLTQEELDSTLEDILSICGDLPEGYDTYSPEEKFQFIETVREQIGIRYVVE